MDIPTPEQSKAYIEQGLNSLGETPRKARERCVLMIKESFGDRWDALDESQKAHWISLQVEMDNSLEELLTQHFLD